MRKQAIESIAELFDVEDRAVKRWVARGCPHDGGGRGKKLFFNEAEVAAWLKANNLTGKVGKPKQPISAELEAAKLRKELAMARKHELDVAQREGLLVERTEVEKNTVEKITVVKNRLLGLGAKLAAQVEGMTGAERQAAIDAEVQEILSEFSRG
jgi:phage terminase Nu1 subunit (DNA packaging protein)